MKGGMNKSWMDYPLCIFIMSAILNKHYTKLFTPFLMCVCKIINHCERTKESWRLLECDCGKGLKNTKT